MRKQLRTVCEINKKDRIVGDQMVDKMFQTQEFKDQQLILAAFNGNVEKVLTLLGAGANPNTKENVPAVEGATALDGSIVSHNISIMRILIEHGANIFGADTSKVQPLEKTIEESFEAGFWLLMEKGAALDAKSKKAIVVVSKSGDVCFCKDKTSRIYEWTIKTAKEIRPATMYDLVLSNLCLFSEETKRKVRTMMKDAVQKGLVELTQSEIEMEKKMAAIAAPRPKKITKRQSPKTNEKPQKTKD